MWPLGFCLVLGTAQLQETSAVSKNLFIILQTSPRGLETSQSKAPVWGPEIEGLAVLGGTGR